MSTEIPLPPEGERGNKIGGFDRALTRFVTGTHRRIIQLSRGRLMGHMGGNPLLLLTTTGRSSGRTYQNQVIGVRDSDGWLIVASNGGAASHPQWIQNIAVHPDVIVEESGKRTAMRAHILSDQERAESWPILTRAYPNFGRMQSRTDRTLPVVRLSRTSQPSAVCPGRVPRHRAW
jgi:deazaflavin-dependent oxidoreductase (nitroreductase family)